jgi:hypothetical protein
MGSMRAVCGAVAATSVLVLGAAVAGHADTAPPPSPWSSGLGNRTFATAPLTQVAALPRTPGEVPFAVALRGRAALNGAMTQLAQAGAAGEEEDEQQVPTTEQIEAMPRPMSPLLRLPGPDEAVGESLGEDAFDQYILPYLDPDRGETVATRRRPELEPLGVRLGGFVLRPAISAEEVFNTNIFATATNEEADFITRILPTLVLASDWTRHGLSLRVGAEAGFYAENSDEDYIDYLAGAEGRLDITGDASLTGSADYRHLHEERGSPDDVAGVEPTEFDTLLFTAGYGHRFGRFRARLAGVFEGLDFDDVEAIGGGTINNDDRDRIQAEGTARLGYEIVPNYEAFVQGSYNIRDYDASVDDAGFNRDSDGFGVVAGLTVDFGGITFGDFYVGYRQQDYDDPAFDTINGLDAGAALTWNVTPLTTVIGGVRRTVEETTSAGSGGYFGTEVSLSVDHELLRSLILGLDGRYVMRDYDGIEREDDYFEIGGDVLYMLNRNIYLSAGYEYRDRSSSEAGEDYSQHVAMVRLTLQQ